MAGVTKPQVLQLPWGLLLPPVEGKAEFGWEIREK